MNFFEEKNYYVIIVVGQQRLSPMSDLPCWETISTRLMVFWKSIFTLMILSYKQHRDSVNKHNVIIQTLCVIRGITKLRLISYENVTMWIEKQVIIDKFEQNLKCWLSTRNFDVSQNL